MMTRFGARGRLGFSALLLALSACAEHTDTTLAATTDGRESDATDVASATDVINVTTDVEPVAPVRMRKTTVTSRLHELYGQDYLQRDPMESLIRAYASGVEPMTPAPDGSLVNYVSFDGDSYQMLQFNGEHTAVLLSPADFEFNGIARVRKAIDELDLIYATYQDVMGWEPYGDGLLRVAMLTKTCGWGCGWVGWRGVEMYPDAFSGSDFQGVAIHEIGHNFDHVNGLLYNSGDRAHSFTAYWDAFIRHFLRKGGNGLKPEEDLARNVNEWLLPYENFGGRSWQSCIVDRSCDPPGGNDANGFAVTTEGIVVQRILQFYGAQKLRSWMPQLTSLVDQRGIEESNLTANDRLDLLIESLSLTVNANLSCFFDYWNWPLSSAARARIASLPSSTFCADNDHDGFTPLTRDCLDSNPSVRPWGTEVVNGLDDDCNNTIDDVAVYEGPDFPNSGDQALPVYSVNTHIIGSYSQQGDDDYFKIRLTAPTTLRVTIKSPSALEGFFFIDNPDGSWLDYRYFGSYSSDQVWKIPLAAGDWTMHVGNWDGHLGEYELSFQKDYAFPVDRDLWPVTFAPIPAAVSTTNPSAVNLPIPAVPASLVGTPNLTTEFWVSNFGVVGSLPSSAASPFVWTPPADANLQKLTYRVMFRQDATPVHPYSQHVSLFGPLPWSNRDVGQVGLPGSATHFSEADLTVNGAGTDIGGTSDAMHLAYRPWSGDGEIIAQLLSVQNTDPAAKVGVMFRESLTANAKQASVVLAANGGLSFLRRTSTGGSTSATSGGTSATPTWVRLTRAGRTVTGYRSADGIAWTKVGSSSITMATNIYVGVAVTSKNNSLLATANVDRVSIRKP